MSEVVFREHIKSVGDFTSEWVKTSKFEDLMQILPNLAPRDWTYNRVWERTLSELVKHIKGAPDKLPLEQLFGKMVWCIFNQPQNGEEMLKDVRTGLKESATGKVYVCWTIDIEARVDGFTTQPDGFAVIDFEGVAPGLMTIH